MAYMNQERKKARMPAIKALLNKYGVKGSVSVLHHSALRVTLSEGEVDFGNNDYHQVNTHWIEKYYEGDAKNFLLELKDAMLGVDYYNNSDIMTDYFEVSHYIYIEIGRWDKPYVLKQKLAEVA